MTTKLYHRFGTWFGWLNKQGNWEYRLQPTTGKFFHRPDLMGDVWQHDFEEKQG